LDGRRHVRLLKDDRDHGPQSLWVDQSHFVVAPSYGWFGPRFRGVRNLTGS